MSVISEIRFGASNFRKFSNTKSFHFGGIRCNGRTWMAGYESSMPFWKIYLRPFRSLHRQLFAFEMAIKFVKFRKRLSNCLNLITFDDNPFENTVSTTLFENRTSPVCLARPFLCFLISSSHFGIKGEPFYFETDWLIDSYIMSHWS